MKIEKILDKFVNNEIVKSKILKYLNTITSDMNEQICILYETIYASSKNKTTFLDLLKKKEFLYHHSHFHDLKKTLQDEEFFLKNPPTIEDGIIECRKCHSNKTYSYAKQTRASDEGTSVFVTCSQCQFKFRL